MRLEDFNALIFADLNAYIAGLRAEKADEYADDEDTLRNFHVLGPAAGLTPAHYCVALLVKHVGAIAHQISRGDWAWEYRTKDGGEGLKQRLADAKIYVDLLFALLHEEAEAGGLARDDTEDMAEIDLASFPPTAELRTWHERELEKERGAVELDVGTLNWRDPEGGPGTLPYGEPGTLKSMVRAASEARRHIEEGTA